jgi:hypothetical protein
MVFDCIILDSSGRTLRDIQLHIPCEGINKEQEALARALITLSEYLVSNPLGKLPASISIKIAHV